MKRLLILSLAIFCCYSYGCRSTKSDVSWNRIQALQNIRYSENLYGSVLGNICEKKIFVLQFNGNNYSKMTATYDVSSNTDKDYTWTEVLEENENEILYYSLKDGKEEGRVSFAKNRHPRDYCDWGKEYVTNDTFNTMFEKDSEPFMDIKVNGKEFSTEVTTFTVIKSTDKNDSVYHQLAKATNDELKGFTVFNTERNNKTNASIVKTMKSFSFIKK